MPCGAGLSLPGFLSFSASVSHGLSLLETAFPWSLPPLFSASSPAPRPLLRPAWSPVCSPNGLYSPGLLLALCSYLRFSLLLPARDLSCPLCARPPWPSSARARNLDVTVVNFFLSLLLP